MKRSQTLSRGHFILLVACVAGLAVPTFHGKPSGEINKPPADLHLYLLIGGANMAGRAEIPGDAGDIIDRCYLLNDKNEWEPNYTNSRDTRKYWDELDAQMRNTLDDLGLLKKGS